MSTDNAAAIKKLLEATHALAARIGDSQDLRAARGMIQGALRYIEQGETDKAGRLLYCARELIARVANRATGQTEAARKYHRARILGEGEPIPALTAWIKEASE